MPRAAQQLTNGHTERLALDIPEREIQRGARVDGGTQRLKHEHVQPLDIEGVFANNGRTQMLVDVALDDLYRVATPGRRRYGLANAGDIVVRVHLYDHGVGRARDAVCSGKITSARDIDNCGGDFSDLHGMLYL